MFLYSTFTEKKTTIRNSADFEAHKIAVVIDNQLSLSAEVCPSSKRNIWLIQLICCLPWYAVDLTCKRKLGWDSHRCLDLHQEFSYPNIIKKDFDMSKFILRSQFPTSTAHQQLGVFMLCVFYQNSQYNLAQNCYVIHGCTIWLFQSTTGRYCTWGKPWFSQRHC